MGWTKAAATVDWIEIEQYLKDYKLEYEDMKPLIASDYIYSAVQSLLQYREKFDNSTQNYLKPILKLENDKLLPREIGALVYHAQDAFALFGIVLSMGELDLNPSLRSEKIYVRKHEHYVLMYIQSDYIIRVNL